MIHDGLMAALSFVLSLYLRVGDSIWKQDPVVLAQDTALFTLLVLGFAAAAE